MLTYAQVTAKMVRDSSSIKFENLHKYPFEIWQSTPRQVIIRDLITMKTLAYNNVKNAMMYANLCKLVDKFA